MKNTYELPATEDYYIEEDLNEDLSRKHDIFRQSDIEKMKKEIPGFENLLQKTIENKLTDEDVQKFSNNPFSQDPEKQMKRQERRKSEELRNVLRQGRTNER
jgi:oligoribonuclease NrnB/cAMP/cGMP phosphodiesterase (DHH superfamily)